jgi:hypothetical protein
MYGLFQFAISIILLQSWQIQPGKVIILFENKNV